MSVFLNDKSVKLTLAFAKHCSPISSELHFKVQIKCTDHFDLSSKISGLNSEGTQYDVSHPD
jgi:hypothetical protein